MLKRSDIINIALMFFVLITFMLLNIYVNRTDSLFLDIGIGLMTGMFYICVAFFIETIHIKTVLCVLLSILIYSFILDSYSLNSIVVFSMAGAIIGAADSRSHLYGISSGLIFSLCVYLFAKIGLLYLISLPVLGIFLYFSYTILFVIKYRKYFIYLILFNFALITIFFIFLTFSKAPISFEAMSKIVLAACFVLTALFSFVSILTTKQAASLATASGGTPDAASNNG